MQYPETSEGLIRLLLTRLERISVDSYWAHRASGVRGALTKILGQMEMGEPVDPARSGALSPTSSGGGAENLAAATSSDRAAPAPSKN